MLPYKINCRACFLFLFFVFATESVPRSGRRFRLPYQVRPHARAQHPSTYTRHHHTHARKINFSHFGTCCTRSCNNDYAGFSKLSEDYLNTTGAPHSRVRPHTQTCRCARVPLAHHSLPFPPTHSLTHSLAHSFTRSPTHSLTRSPTHSLIH